MDTEMFLTALSQMRSSGDIFARIVVLEKELD